MSKSRAIRSAFSEVFRNPVTYLTELVWRSVVCTAIALVCVYAAIAYLHSLEVTELDLWGLSGLVPGTATVALRHIFQGSGPALVRAVIAATCGSMLIWWMASSLGRSATLASLVHAPRPALNTVASLNVARCIVWMLGLISLIGAYTFAFSRAQISTSDHDRAKLYAIFLPLIALIAWSWSTLSWYLKLALVPAAQHDRGIIDAIQVAGSTVKRHGRQFAWVGFVTSVTRGTVFFIAAFFAFFVLSIAIQSQAAVGWIIVLVYALLCLVAFTFIQLLQLAAYARVFAWANANAGLD